MKKPLRITVQLPDNLAKWLKNESKERGFNLSVAIRYFLTNTMNNEKG
jgi:hypothetical protein